MTISITIPGVTFTKFVSKVLLPYMESALAYNLYGGDAASSCLNRAVGATLNASVIGAPVYSPAYALLRNMLHGFNLGQMLAQPYTQIAIVQKTAGADIAVFGRGTGNADNFSNMLLLKDSNVVQEWSNGNAGISAVGRNDTAFQMVGAAWKGGEKNKAFLHTGTMLVESLNSGNLAVGTVPTNNLRVGSCWYDDTGYFRVAATVVFNRVLTYAEILEVYAYLKGVVASRGVVMV